MSSDLLKRQCCLLGLSEAPLIGLQYQGIHNTSDLNGMRVCLMGQCTGSVSIEAWTRFDSDRLFLPLFSLAFSQSLSPNCSVTLLSREQTHLLRDSLIFPLSFFLTLQLASLYNRSKRALASIWQRVASSVTPRSSSCPASVSALHLAPQVSCPADCRQRNTFLLPFCVCAIQSIPRVLDCLYLFVQPHRCFHLTSPYLSTLENGTPLPLHVLRLRLLE